MKAKNIVILSDSDLAFDCHRFFTHYGFEIQFFVLEGLEAPEELRDAAVFEFGEIDEAMLAGLDCPVIIASSNPAFISAAKGKLNSLAIREHQIFTETLIYSAWLQELIDKLSFNSTNCPNEFLAHLLDTHPPGLSESQHTVEALAQYMSRKIRRQIDTEAKTLAVYYPSNAYRMNLGSEEMYDKIREQGYNVIFLFGVLCNDEFEKRKHSYYAGHDIVNCLDFVDVFLIPTMMLGLPERTKKVLFVHDIYDSPLGAEGKPRLLEAGEFPQESPFLNELDYVFLPCRAVMRANSIHTFVRKKPLCRIPGGYVKIDNNIRYFENSGLGADSIIYAPTVTRGDFADYVSVPEYGERIVEALLETFPDYRIIFRPHPHTLETEDVRNIADRFKCVGRFVFDSNASFYNDNYCRSAVMVTDMSGTGFTYAFMTLRPVVFFSHREEDVAEAFNNVKYFEDRERIGYVATTIEDLKNEVACALKNRNRFARRIRKFRDESIFNLGRAEDYFAENFHYIAEGKIHKDWQYVIAPFSQSDARLLEPLHDQINEFIEEISCRKKAGKTRRIAADKLEQTLCEKGGEIEAFWREAQEKNASIAGFSETSEQREQAIASLSAELDDIRSRWWFRLFFRTKKSLTAGERRDR